MLPPNDDPPDDDLDGEVTQETDRGFVRFDDSGRAHASGVAEVGVIVSGEAVPPDEHTARVRTRRASRRGGPPSTHRIHDGPREASAADVAGFSEANQRARRARRRARDHRAERRALHIAIGAFLGLGAAAWLVINVALDEPSSTTIARDAIEGSDARAATEAKDVRGPSTEGAGPGATQTANQAADRTADPTGHSPKRPLRVSSPAEASLDLLALREMATQGLTIVAEGLPEVSAKSGGGPGIPILATIETCRFAYGVWEFSPNRVFRFMPTCEALAGQILVGAYEVDEGVVRMSPLRSAPAEIISEFQVEKPSTMKSHVRIRVGGKEVQFLVRQAVTVIRGGLEGDMFRTSYAARNTVRVPGVRSEPSADSASGPGSGGGAGSGSDPGPGPGAGPGGAGPGAGAGSRGRGDTGDASSATDPLLELLEKHRGR